jgi:hypothetical protein
MQPSPPTYTSSSVVYEAITGYRGSESFLGWDAGEVGTWLREQVGLSAAAELIEARGIG